MYSLHFTPNQCNLTASQSTALISSDSSDQNEDCIEYPDICLPFKNTQSSFHPMSYEIE